PGLRQPYAPRRRASPRPAPARGPVRRARPHARLDSGGRACRRLPLPMTAARDLDELPRTPEGHFQLHLYAAVLELRAQLPAPDEHNGLGFLRGYYDELDRAGFEPGEHIRWWRRVHAWEPDASVHLPLRAVREAFDLGPRALTMLFTAGLP